MHRQRTPRQESPVTRTLIADGVDAANCNSFTLAQALAGALDAHAQIINMSLSGPYDPLLHDLMQEGSRRGVIIIGAATSAVAPAPPGLMQQPGILEVASVGNSHVPPSCLFAPGNEILTLLPGGRYDFASGDSIATAQVSGVVALMLANHPGLTVDLAYRLLCDSAGGRDAGPGNSVDAAAAVLGLHNSSLGGLSPSPVVQ
jgi:subtilisin family serine protease